LKSEIEAQPKTRAGIIEDMSLTVEQFRDML